jgi:hypothetical protein
MAEYVSVDFRPSRHGFHFANSWPHGAPARLGPVTLFRIRGGMCGGMCVAARSRWRASNPPPEDLQAPREGPLADAIWRAQLASLRLPFGPLRYLWLQLPPISAAARRRLVLSRAVPAVRAAVDGGTPRVLGLIRTTSWNPRASSRNHQVLAYGYRPGEDGSTDILVYDPNWPDDDGVVLHVAADGTVAHPDGEPVTTMFPAS